MESVMPYVLLLFIAMPIIEIAVLLKVGDAIGWLTTLAVVILTSSSSKCCCAVPHGAELLERSMLAI